MRIRAYHRPVTVSDFEAISRQFLRALRSNRSQAAFSRRLGFRSNVAAKWEAGQRMPNAVDVFAHSLRLGIDLRAVLHTFAPGAFEAVGDPSEPQLAPWLNSLRGTQRLKAVSERSGLSRYSVGRFLTGHAQPRLPQFFALVEALTDRLPDLVEHWVGIEHVPLLEERYLRNRAARDALFSQPLCLAVMCLLDTTRLDRPATEQIEAMALTLEQSPAAIETCLETLSVGGVIRRDVDRFRLSGSLTVDAHSTKERERSARVYWTGLAHERAKAPAPDDLCSYNVFSIGKKDYAALQNLQREFYRGARALIAASEPTDMAGLLVVQLVSWQPPAD